MALGQAIAEKRARRGWTLRELEKRSGVGNGIISQIERGITPDPQFSTVAALAGALNLSLPQLAKLAKKPKRKA